MKHYDTLVLGLGAMGSAAAYQLAKRGKTVLGIDRFTPPHGFGSSHGETRITRLAIGEGVHYTPLALRSHEIWREIEKATGELLLTITGGLIISSKTGCAPIHVENFLANTVAAAEKYGIAHELLDAKDIRKRFPAFKVRDDETGYFEAEAGFLRPEACIAAQLKLAAAHGAEIHTGEKVSGFEAYENHVAVRTDKASYDAEKLVITAGPWIADFLSAKYAKHFRVHRQVLFWFEVDGPAAPFTTPDFPIFIWELQGARSAIYGFPAIDGSNAIKIATETYDRTTTADTVNREVAQDEAAIMHRDFVAPYLAHVSARCAKAAACLYTVTRDARFVIDTHPDHANVLIASPCSGHGFKHSAAIGEALAVIVTEGRSRLDLSEFGMGRLKP